MNNEFKPEQAVALSYDSSIHEAPKIVAKGKGIVANNIIEEAIKHDIPIQEDSSLVELLGELNINEKIPNELYQAVAEIFAFVYRMDQEMKNVKK
ncbi:hypothetical protein FZC66_03680 [Priestia megaterium]|nr:hypothetical protein FZC66_03680 [Priestia megaterium]